MARRGSNIEGGDTKTFYRKEGKGFRKEGKGFREEQQKNGQCSRYLMQPHGMGLHPKIERRFCLASRKLDEVDKT
jgi:hypothetical protein